MERTWEISLPQLTSVGARVFKSITDQGAAVAAIHPSMSVGYDFRGIAFENLLLFTHLFHITFVQFWIKCRQVFRNLPSLSFFARIQKLTSAEYLVTFSSFAEDFVDNFISHPKGNFSKYGIWSLKVQKEGRLKKTLTSSDESSLEIMRKKLRLYA